MGSIPGESDTKPKIRLMCRFNFVLTLNAGWKA
ncbi:hypothetical protein PF008_g32965 [Phytophthora fragariae]|uniref:Uncharacterized protein n=1 Tax=Phytophthora fragariae TaxID=53985 RepID=A0A6G0PYT9_9STRA|nr:hypothetical protein PF008_g32965 [Phytophthora fragariae]